MSRNTPTDPDFTPAEERRKLQEEWGALTEQKKALDRLEAELADRTPGDVTRPIQVSMPIPIELPPKVVWGAVVGFITLTVAVVGGAAAIYWRAHTHMSSASIHVMEPDGIPTMVKRAYETAAENKAIRLQLISDIEKKMALQHTELKNDLVKVLAPQKYARWKAREEARIETEAAPAPDTGL